MQFEEYVYLLAQELDFSPLTKNQRQQAIASFTKEPLSRGVTEEQLQRLLKTKTAAIKNAPPTRRFPLVVYAHIAPSGNNIMCEYLASHGFVVATIPWKGTFEYNLDVGLTGVETQIKDIEFAIGLLRKDPNVDGNKIATIGMSFGAISTLGLQSRNSDVDALISLDGGIGSAFGAAVVQRTPYYSLSRISTPLLHLYGSNVPGTDLTFLQSLKVLPPSLHRLSRYASRRFHEPGNAGTFYTRHEESTFRRFETGIRMGVSLCTSIPKRLFETRYFQCCFS